MRGRKKTINPPQTGTDPFIGLKRATPRRNAMKAIERAWSEMPQHGQELPAIQDMLAELGFVPIPV